MVPVIPPSPAQPGAWDAAVASRIIAAHAGLEGPGVPILHALQAAFGCVPKQSESLIAAALKMSRAEVYGLISFYRDFRRTPPGRHVLKLCRAEACQAMGGTALATRLLERLGIGWGGTTADGSLTVDPASCLGLCACGPAALLGDEPLARLDDHALAGIVHEASLA